MLMGTPPLNIEAVLERLKALHPQKIDLSLGRIKRLLRALGNPERDLPPVIHVAGTNGKGSAIAFMKAMAEEAGLKPHVYTSPHLVRFNERIQPAGCTIGDDHLTQLLVDCEAANGSAPITFFEITTAAAFLAFASEPADLTLIETGLGGRLDATNVIKHPAVTVITPISIDHQHFLGRRLTDIAAEKAGILKPRVPAVFGPQHAVAARVLNERARKLQVPVFRWGRDFQAHMDEDSFTYSEPGREPGTYGDVDGPLELPRPALAGPHQAANGATAIAALRALDHPKIDENAIVRGLAGARWPARLQLLDHNPLTSSLMERGFEVWLDGGHNPAAGRALARALATPALSSGEGTPLYLIVGMISSKDAAGFIKPLAGLSPKGLWALPVPGSPAALAPGRIAAIARRAGLCAHETRTVENAFKAIARRPPGRVLITGSLYLAGAVLAQMEHGRRASV